MKPSLAKYIISPLGEYIRGEYFSKYLKELKNTQWYNQDRIRNLQMEKMRSLLKYASENIPFYRNRFNENNLYWKDIKDLGDWQKLPFLSKEDLRNYKEDLLAQGYAGRLSKKTTGGSTGEAVTLYKSRQATAYLRAVMWRNYGWSGIHWGDKQGRFWGVPLNFWSREKYRVIDFLMNRIRLSAFSFSEDSMYVYYDRLKKFKPKYLYGYVSMLMAFAKFINEKDLDPLILRVKTIITTAEVLYQFQRKYLQETFQCKVVNEYGCGEVGPIAYECPAGSMHIMADNLYVEFVDQSKEKADDEIKQVVITELNNRAMPLIRYKIEDFAIPSNRRCRCGRGLPVVKKVVGRAYDFVVSPTGRYFHGEYFMYILEILKTKKMGIRQFQIIQTNKKHLTVKFVKDDNFTEKALKFIEKRIYGALGNQINIKFEKAINIPREKSGKIRLIISNVG